MVIDAKPDKIVDVRQNSSEARSLLTIVSLMESSGTTCVDWMAIGWFGAAMVAGGTTIIWMSIYASRLSLKRLR